MANNRNTEDSPFTKMASSVSSTPKKMLHQHKEGVLSNMEYAASKNVTTVELSLLAKAKCHC
jgi:hypothetical protein